MIGVRIIRNIYLTCLCFIMIMSMPLYAMAEEDYTDTREMIEVVINDEQVAFDDPVFLVDGRLYVPVRHLVESLQGIIDWDPIDQKVYIRSAHGDGLIFTIGETEMLFNHNKYLMDAAPFIQENRTYIPLRHAAEFLHADVNWDPETYTASISSEPLYVFAEGDSLDSIGAQFDTTAELLAERNEWDAAEPEVGEALKVVIPGIMKEKINPKEPEPEPTIDVESHPDFLLLAKIIQVEAGYESYEGQLAVGSVIMNRVHDERFPNTIRGVIYSPGQFPPAHNGLLDRSEPNESVLKAAKAVLNGENNVEGALYFHNPNVSSGSFWNSLETIEVIGNHRFAR
jgi:N-acetylmuramoyl-L-alanine amidase